MSRNLPALVEIAPSTAAERAAALHQEMRAARQEHIAALVAAMNTVEELARVAMSEVYPPGVRDDAARLAVDIKSRAERIMQTMERVG